MTKRGNATRDPRLKEPKEHPRRSVTPSPSRHRVLDALQRPRLSANGCACVCAASDRSRHIESPGVLASTLQSASACPVARAVSMWSRTAPPPRRSAPGRSIQIYHPRAVRHATPGSMLLNMLSIEVPSRSNTRAVCISAVRWVAVLASAASAAKALVSASKPPRADSGDSGNTASMASRRGVLTQSGHHRSRIGRRCHFECAAALRAPAQDCRVQFCFGEVFAFGLVGDARVAGSAAVWMHCSRPRVTSRAVRFERVFEGEESLPGPLTSIVIQV